MSVVLWAVGLSLLMQGPLCSVGRTARGCMTWKVRGDHVCCEVCHPGNRLVKDCGPRPRDLCTPCEPNTFTVKPKDDRCTKCTQCVGALVPVEGCTATTDTKCGCKEGLTCGDDVCSFCVTRCDKGQEPTENRSCRSCPDGTFNDQSQQKCKPWSITCPKADQNIVAKGDAFNDIKCDNVSLGPEQPDPGEETLVVPVLTSVALITFSIVVIIIVTIKVNQKRKRAQETITKAEIIGTPTDDPRTLIAMECSFYEAEQEQGGSSESLASRPLAGDRTDGGQLMEGGDTC